MVEGALQQLRGQRRRLVVLVVAGWCVACGIESREYSPEVPPQSSSDRATPAAGEAAAEATASDGSGAEAAESFAWPNQPNAVARLDIQDYGTIRLGLFSEVAPKTVENFVKLAEEGFYDGTSFHRVIEGFMVQGGDPNSKDDDPSNDGSGGPGYRLSDEFSAAPHLRGVVAMANTGRKDSGGSQFFMVQKTSHFLDGKYSAFGYVLDGMEVVDKIASVETDRHGRWGTKDRPLEKVVLERVTIEPAPAAAEDSLAAGM